MTLVYDVLFLICVILIVSFLFIEYMASDATRQRLSQLYKRAVGVGDDRYLSLRTFADCEHELSGVSRVVVICSHVEKPTSKLASAVIDNFGQGIKYEFFVGKGGAGTIELQNYYSWFQALFSAAAQIDGNSKKVLFQDVFSVRLLDIPWRGSPYVFHVSEKKSNGHENEVVYAYRGLDLTSGISKFYERVSLQEAMTIITLCAAASKDFQSAIPLNVSDEGNVVPLFPVREDKAAKDVEQNNGGARRLH